MNYNTTKIAPGTVFGKLTVLRYAGSNARHESQFECLCECGTRTLILGAQLKNGKSKSCGCAHKRGKNNIKWKGYEELGGSHWNDIVFGAKKRKLDIDITIKEAWELFVKQNKCCAITKVPITMRQYFKDTQATASLDRIDSSKGYVAGNVQWVHKVINEMKMDQDQQRFVYWCKLAANNN